MPINVPYCSQWSDPGWTKAIINDLADPCSDPTWVQRGFRTKDEYRYWSRRTCGLACLESMLQYWGIPACDRSSLLQKAINRGAYRVSESGAVQGLIYRPFADWLSAEYGLQVQIHPKSPLDRLLEQIPVDGFGMASVAPEIRNPSAPNPTRGGHLVLILHSDADHVVFHNPSGVPPYQAHATLPRVVFERFYADRGMVISRTSPAQ